jgi:uncharacterized membrane protein YqjE
VNDGSSPQGSGGGLRAALVRLGAAGIEFSRTRIELATLEFSEERERTTRRLILVAVAALGFTFALLGASAFVVVWFWDTHRLLALGVVTLIYVLIGVFALMRMQAFQRSAPKPFATTLAELERDRDWLRERFGK